MTTFGLRKVKGVLAPRLDPAGGDPVLAELRAAAAAGNVADVVGALRGFTGPDLSALVSGVSDVGGLETLLPEEIRGSPNAPLPRLLLGARIINRGLSEFHGAARVAVTTDTKISPEQTAKMRGQLEQAEEHLYVAARLDHASSAPWYFLLASARWLYPDQELRLRRFEAVTSRDPAHFGAHRERLQQLGKGLDGSHEQMHAFAQEAMRASDDPQMGVLVAEAHIEHWHDLSGGEAGRAYLSSTAVSESLAEAADRSIRRPDFAAARDPYLGYNMFAFAFSLGKQYPAARRAFAATCGVVTTYPWRHLAKGPLDGYLLWRRAARENR
jgi:hypothetical protein